MDKFCLDCGEKIEEGKFDSDDLFCCLECRQHYMANHTED